jgi:hypothetical protein
MPRMLDMLHVYDATVSELHERRDADHVIRLKGGGFDLSQALKKLVDQGYTFKRAVITSHGKPGKIELDRNHIDAERLRELFANKGYEALFPKRARIYFNGCNVGEEPGGLAFMTAAAQIFLRRAGGTAFGMTSAGVFVDGLLGALVLPLGVVSLGHVVHLGGKIVSVTVGPGGSIVPEAPVVWPDPPNHRDNVGSKI